GAGPHRNVAARGGDAVQGGSVHDEVLEHGESSGPPRLDHDGVAVVEVAHVKLTQGGGAFGAVGLAVDHGAAGAADAFTTVAVEGDGLFPFQLEALVQDVEHLEEGDVRVHVAHLVGFEPARRLGILLTPNLEGQVDRLSHYL